MKRIRRLPGSVSWRLDIFKFCSSTKLLLWTPEDLQLYNSARFCTFLLAAHEARVNSWWELRRHKERSVQTVVRGCLPRENYWFDPCNLRLTVEEGSNFGPNLWGETQLLVININPWDHKVRFSRKCDRPADRFVIRVCWRHLAQSCELFAIIFKVPYKFVYL